VTTASAAIGTPPAVRRRTGPAPPRREVAASAGLAEVGEVGVGLLDPAARGPEDLAGNVVKPTGRLTCGGACPAARAWARPLSQYDRAAEAPVPVSQ